MVDEVRDKMAEAGFETKRVEGVNASGWVLMDYGDVVVHVFQGRTGCLRSGENLDGWKEDK